MPLPLPNLDVRRYDDLVAELRGLIPQLAPRWTNHNAADPGITLIEMLAWLTEATLYRIDRTPEATYWNFIKLLRADSPALAQPRPPLSSAKVEVLRWFNERYRAVTAEDFEELVMQQFGSEVARARAIPNVVDGMVTVVIVPRPRDPLPTPEALDATRDVVKAFLDQRRLVGTRVRVRAPHYTPVTLDIDVESIPEGDLTEPGPIATAIMSYLDPVAGGAQASGWPFGRPVSIHDLAPLVESLHGVGRVPRVMLNGEPGRTEAEVAELPRISELRITLDGATSVSLP